MGVHPFMQDTGVQRLLGKAVAKAAVLAGADGSGGVCVVQSVPERVEGVHSFLEGMRPWSSATMTTSLATALVQAYPGLKHADPSGDVAFLTSTEALGATVQLVSGRVRLVCFVAQAGDVAGAAVLCKK